MNQSSKNDATEGYAFGLSTAILLPEVATHTPVMFGETDVALLPKLEECNIGIEPTEYNVFIIQVPVQEKVGKLGLIIAADSTKDRNSAIEQYGRIIAVSPLAFNFDKNFTNGNATPPQVGDVVRFARFAGGEFTGFDGKEYRTIKDKDILGIVNKELLGE